VGDDGAPLIDGAGGWTGVRMGFAPTAWCRSPPLKETKMSERLETLKKARELRGLFCGALPIAGQGRVTLSRLALA
jgi:hypothetical protein